MSAPTPPRPPEMRVERIGESDWSASNPRLRFRRLSELVPKDKQVTNWVRVATTRGFFAAYRRLGMWSSDFTDLGGNNVWVSQDGRFRVRVAEDDECKPGHSERVIEVRVFDFVEDSDGGV